MRYCKKCVEENLPKNHKLKCLAPNPFPSYYWPETYTLPELPPDHASYYQSHNGINSLMIELGRVDKSTEVYMLSSHMVLPCQGHLEADLHIISYLSLHNNSRLCVDSMYPSTGSTQFQVCDWIEFYGDVEEHILPNAPEAIEKVGDLYMFVDSDYAGDQHK